MPLPVLVPRVGFEVGVFGCCVRLHVARRSPKKLLRAVVARLLGRRPLPASL
jgi:hypothetical protein